MKYDYLIVGQGLIGSLLAWDLKKRNHSFLCVDAGEAHTASKAAAWMVNPVTGFRFVKSWRWDNFLPIAQQYYQDWEKLLDRHLFHSLPILRLFQNLEEHNFWKKRKSSGEISTFIRSEFSDTNTFPYLDHNGGGAEICGGGWVDLAPILSTIRSELLATKVLQIERFEPGDLRLSDSGAYWKDHFFKHVLFSQGYTRDNPWFDWLPWKPAKGEVLTLRIPGLPEEQILHRGVFLIPLGDHLFRCGATYHWHDLTSTPTEASKWELLQKASALVPNSPIEVIAHRAGIRPILKDTRPVAGRHPAYPQLSILNGMGSKAALMAPFCVHHLLEHLESHTPLDPQIDVLRNT